VAAHPRSLPAAIADLAGDQLTRPELADWPTRSIGRAKPT
jgi:hypothetical protein